MTTLKALKRLIEKFGGDASNVDTNAEAVNCLSDYVPTAFYLTPMATWDANKHPDKGDRQPTAEEVVSLRDKWLAGQATVFITQEFAGLDGQNAPEYTKAFTLTEDFDGGEKYVLVGYYEPSGDRFVRVPMGAPIPLDA